MCDHAVFVEGRKTFVEDHECSMHPGRDLRIGSGGLKGGRGAERAEARGPTNLHFSKKIF